MGRARRDQRCAELLARIDSISRRYHRSPTQLLLVSLENAVRATTIELSRPGSTAAEEAFSLLEQLVELVEGENAEREVRR